MSGDDKVFTYPGSEADVHWDGRLCIHVGECGRAEGDLFVGKRQPWCQPDLVAIGNVVEVVERCPTGALTYARKDGGDAEVADEDNTVVVSNNGPLYVRGDLSVDGAESDMDGVQFRVALCRCGQSARKPFCDNSHEDAKFVDRGAVGRTGDGIDGSGPLEIKRAKDGPLLLSGPHTIISAGGQRTFKGTKSALCRCGESANKPFCDGSHKAAGFKAD